MSFTIGEDLLHFGVHLAIIRFQRAAHHADAAKGDDGAFQRRIGLQTDDLFQIAVDIARFVCGNGGNGMLVNIQHAAGLTLLFHQLFHLCKQFFGFGGGTRQKRIIALVRGVVVDNKVAYIDGVFHSFPP